MSNPTDQLPTILRAGDTCWQAPKARKAAVLVDAQPYFQAFASALAQAQRSVLIAGWDIDSRVELWRDERHMGLPRRLGDFLNAVVSRREDLHIHVLAWDFAMIYALEREPLPVFQLGWRTHRRVHFHLDDLHPVGGSHHQKVVVVDDAVAFAGGIDLTKNRWDTSAHRPNDERRRAPGGDPYRPFHDAQMVVSGEAAAVLGDLVRERWERATGERLSPPPDHTGDPWPEGVTPEFEEVTVGVARTHPAFGGYPEVREVERLYREAIQVAKRSIYIENQYLTSQAVCDALVARLSEDQGPEVVLVIPRYCSGWLEESTMGALRTRVLERLREADRFGRLHVYYPHVEGLEEGFLNVHAKVLILDDLLLRVGSANLSNRSMGLDTECDLAIEAIDEETRNGIAAVRDRLLAEHLGVPAQRVTESLEQRGSIAGTVERLASESRGLRPLPPEASWVEPMLPDAELVDPEKPVALDRMIEEFEPDERQGSGRRLLLAAGLLMTLAGLAAAWRWTPLGQWFDRETLTQWVHATAASRAAPLWVLAIYVAAGLTCFPLVLLILVTAAVFGPLLGFAYAMLGGLSSAVVVYGAGRWLGRDTVRKMAGARLNRLSRRLARKGFLTVVTVRVVPVAPFTVINLVAGASHIHFRDFVLGSLAGMAPGTLAIAVFGDRLQEAMVHPGPRSFLILGALAAIVFAGARWVKQRVEH